MRDAIIHTLRNNKDVFSWTYEEMSGLDPLLVTHKLAVAPAQKPVKQPPRILRPEIEIQVKQEIEKQLKAGFI